MKDLSIGIYKIENLTDGKVYIGQSVHIEKRFAEHCRSNSLIGQAIQQEGKDNFIFSIIEECPEYLLDAREKFYIQKYNSITPNGYNITSGGSSQNQVFKRYTPQVLDSIIQDIKKSELSFLQISKKYGLDLSMVYYLNRGDYHTIEGEQYPLRKIKDMTKQHYYCVDCGKEISKGAIRCSVCEHIRQQTCERPSREVLKDMIRTETFVSIGKSFSVSDNAIKKWCKAYNLPYRKSDIKKYSDEMWSEI